MDTGARKRREIPIDELYRLEKSRDAHDYCGTKVRSRVVDGKTWVMFADICKVLGYKNARHQVKYIPDGEKLKVEFGLKNTTVNCVNRDGLLRTCLLSQREDTLSFFEWAEKEIFGGDQCE